VPQEAVPHSLLAILKRYSYPSQRTHTN
jgi:hypothetical protein